MRHLLREAGLDDDVHVDSAGTGGWHAGDPPDPRAVAAAARRGITVGGRARQVVTDDFLGFDLLLCADRTNVEDLLRRLPRDDATLRAKVRRLREFDAAALAAGQLDVPDPYYGEAAGFDAVVDQTIAACTGLLAHVL